MPISGRARKSNIFPSEVDNTNYFLYPNPFLRVYAYPIPKIDFFTVTLPSIGGYMTQVWPNSLFKLWQGTESDLGE